MRPSRAGETIAFVLRAGGIAAVVLWWLSIRSFSSRTTYLLHYGSQAIVSPGWEIFVPMPPTTLIVTLCGLAFLLAANEILWRRLRSGETKLPGDVQRLAVAQHAWAWGVGYLAAASGPWLIDFMMHWHIAEPLVRANGIWGPTVWQPLWFAGFSGLAVERWLRALQASHAAPGKHGHGHAHEQKQEHQGAAERGWVAWGSVLGVLLCAALGSAWWFLQSQHAYETFMLGFNDCGHFAQRIANTAAGRGWLVESPVLPQFWDHFNPGLTLLVPLWQAWPDMSLLFWIQALSLAGCAPLIMLIARALGAAPLSASLWAVAWLAQPVLGQMNLAYSYGWHPISLAIPALLVAVLCVIKRHWYAAAAAAAFASSMEEGVLVIIATTAATLFAIELVHGLSKSKSISNAAFVRARRVSALLPARAWLALAALATLTFIVVFRFSGLAEFQTGRFHRLGDSALEILASPVLRPDVFWGLLLRSRNAIFLLGILLPCGIVALARAWPLLIATALPLGVLLVWDHLPAQSLAFHYSSVLLPIVWLTALAGSTALTADGDLSTLHSTHASNRGRGARATALSLAAAALATSIVASINFGQLPWSGKTLGDVAEVTYNPNLELQRRRGAADNQFAHEQLAAIRQRGESVLATGRLATHLVGCSELETVGQFTERRGALAKLTPGEHPLRRYRWLVLDRQEEFQQLRKQSAALEQEALANGFRITADRYDIVVLSRE